MVVSTNGTFQNPPKWLQHLQKPMVWGVRKSLKQRSVHDVEKHSDQFHLQHQQMVREWVVKHASPNNTPAQVCRTKLANHLLALAFFQACQAANLPKIPWHTRHGLGFKPRKTREPVKFKGPFWWLYNEPLQFLEFHLNSEEVNIMIFSAINRINSWSKCVQETVWPLLGVRHFSSFFCKLRSIHCGFESYIMCMDIFVTWPVIFFRRSAGGWTSIKKRCSRRMLSIDGDDLVEGRQFIVILAMFHSDTSSIANSYSPIDTRQTA